MSTETKSKKPLAYSLCLSGALTLALTLTLALFNPAWAWGPGDRGFGPMGAIFGTLTPEQREILRTHHEQARGHHAEKRAFHEEQMALVEELNLSATQLSAIVTVLQQWQPNLEADFGQVRDAMQGIHGQVISTELDATVLENTANDLSAAIAQASITANAVVQDIRQNLTPEQIVIAETLMANHAAMRDEAHEGSYKFFHFLEIFQSLELTDEQLDEIHQTMKDRPFEGFGKRGPGLGHRLGQ